MPSWVPTPSLAHSHGSHHVFLAAKEAERKHQLSELMELNEQSRKPSQGLWFQRQGSWDPTPNLATWSPGPRQPVLEAPAYLLSVPQGLGLLPLLCILTAL